MTVATSNDMIAYLTRYYFKLSYIGDANTPRTNDIQDGWILMHWSNIVFMEFGNITIEEFERKYKLRMRLIQPPERLC